MSVPVKPQERQIIARAGQHARPSHKHCKPCAKHAHAPHTRARTRLYDFHLVEFSHHNPYQSSETTGETSRNDKLRVAGHGPGNTRLYTLVRLLMQEPSQTKLYQPSHQQVETPSDSDSAGETITTKITCMESAHIKQQEKFVFFQFTFNKMILLKRSCSFSRTPNSFSTFTWSWRNHQSS